MKHVIACVVAAAALAGCTHPTATPADTACSHATEAILTGTRDDKINAMITLSTDQEAPVWARRSATEWLAYIDSDMPVLADWVEGTILTSCEGAP